MCSTLGYVGYLDTTIYVSFRGTTNLENILLDLTIGQDAVWSDQPSATVHSGFRQAWLNLAAGISDSISQAQSRCPGCTRVLFTGHSLGAALTTLAAVDFARSGTSLSIQSFTLGSPRVGNSAFSDYAMSMVPNTIRWTHTIDPVVHLPPKFLGFRHRTREVWQNSDTSYITCSATNPEDSSCANSVISIGLTSIDQHSNYGGIPLSSGTCDTFSKRSDFTDEQLFRIMTAANADLQSARTKHDQN